MQNISRSCSKITLGIPLEFFYRFVGNSFRNYMGILQCIPRKFHQESFGNTSLSFSKIPPGLAQDFHQESLRNSFISSPELSSGVPQNSAEVARDFHQGIHTFPGNFFRSSSEIFPRIPREPPQEFYGNSCRSCSETLHDF